MGIPGNTKADSSAKSTYLLHSISSVFPSAFELRRLVRNAYFQLWSRQWSDHPESLRALKPTLCPIQFSKMSPAPTRSRSPVCVSAPPSSHTASNSMDKYQSVSTANSSILLTTFSYTVPPTSSTVSHCNAPVPRLGFLSLSMHSCLPISLHPFWQATFSTVLVYASSE